MTSRELVYATLEFDRPERAPRDLWTLPWAHTRYGSRLEQLRRDFPADITGAPERLAAPTVTRGDPYGVGTYVDEWGCVFTQVSEGIIGEVKDPIVTDDAWEDVSRVHIPTERLTFDRDAVDAFCGETDAFVLSPNLARPFERLQFLRGTENLYIDLTDPPAGLLRFIDAMHALSCRLVEQWAKTDVDGIVFMDDWGEIDRQHLLVDASEDEVRQAVRDVHAKLFRDGGCIAQCEFGAGARIGNVRAVYDEWDRVGGGT